MKDKLFILIVTVVLLAGWLFTDNAHATSCPTFTHEQDILVRKAHAIGSSHDLGYTLAAITWKESIVGDYIVRINATDGQWGSYGVGNMLLTTAMEMEGVENYWRAKARLAPKLINDDVEALSLSMRYLLRHKSLGWRAMIVKYNGRGADAVRYQKDVVRRVSVLQRCLDGRWG